MAQDFIRYDLLMQEALRGLFRRVLTDAAAHGLPGEHHFYITFRTQAPGVQLSDRIRNQYPEQMTIILQHQFWDLKVTEHGFEVGLSFKRIPERLVVPFSAVVAFFDPSVNFGTKFTAEGEDEETSENTMDPMANVHSAPEKENDPPEKAASNVLDSKAPQTETPEPNVISPPNIVSIDAFRKKNH